MQMRKTMKHGGDTAVKQVGVIVRSLAFGVLL